MSEYFIKTSDGKIRGAYSGAKLKALAKNGDISEGCFIRKGDEGKWRPASKVKGLIVVPVNVPTRPDRVDIEIVEPEMDKPRFIPSFVKEFTSDNQNPELIEKLVPEIESVLTSSEVIKYLAIQKKPVPVMTPDCICLTNKRFIFYKKTILGQTKFDDYIWRDLRDAKIKEGLLGATFSVETAAGDRLSMDYLPKSQARKVYQFAQEREEEAREERRLRQLEESRAAAGGVVVQAPATQQQANTTPADDPVAKLQKLKIMFDNDLITQEEYEAKKESILGEM